jgi:hypothetical protein
MDMVCTQLCFHLQQVIRNVHAAHLHHLSVNLLKSTHLHDLLEAASVKAQFSCCHLLLTHPSDLFQIEASYFYNGNDVFLILHIPMAPAKSILRLF